MVCHTENTGRCRTCKRSRSRSTTLHVAGQRQPLPRPSPCSRKGEGMCTARRGGSRARSERHGELGRVDPARFGCAGRRHRTRRTSDRDSASQLYCPGVVLRAAVDLEGDAQVGAARVHDERLDGLLAAQPRRPAASCAKQHPACALCARGELASRARAVAREPAGPYAGVHRRKSVLVLAHEIASVSRHGSCALACAGARIGTPAVHIPSPCASKGRGRGGVAAVRQHGGPLISLPPPRWHVRCVRQRPRAREGRRTRRQRRLWCGR
jgi:hypothetical protein